jgi:hypothetical protein
MKKSIIQILMALLLILLMPASMAAYDFEVDGLYYKLTGPHSVGVTYCDANYNSYSGDITVPPSIVVEGNSYTVSSIEPNAFRGSTDLTSVTLPQNVGSIKSSAFRDCTSLTSVSIPNRDFRLGNRAFMGCTALETIHLTIHITSLPDSLFYGCTGLKTMSLFNYYQIETVGNEVFSGCTSLSSISMPGRVQSYGRGVLRGCTSLEHITLRGSVKEIAPAMFSGCTSLTNVVIPDSITALGDSVFSHCTALTSIDLPDSLKIVGEYAFLYCTGITSMKLPDRMTRIGRGAFCNTGLTSFVVPEGITEIEYSTFMDCYYLKDIVFPSTLKTIGPQAFLSAGFEEIVIPNTVTKLSWAAFNYCHNLKHVQLSDSLTRLTQNVFSSSGLIDIVIPPSVTTIDFGAFQRCTALQSIFIPKTLTTIAGGAFTECGGLGDIIVEAGNPNYDSRDNCNAIIETATNTLLKGGRKTVIPNTVTSVAHGAFNWSSIAQVTFPESVTSIGTAFVRCTNLKEVNISKSLTSIATRAFESCYSLATINIDSDNPVYDSRDSCNAIIETATNTLHTGCPGTKIPEGVTTIAPYAFYGMAAGDQYFTYGISSITLPSTITYIGNNAFNGGSRLLTIISMAAVPPTIENKNAFYTNSYYDATLHVIPSALEAYKNAEFWKDFRMILPLGDNGEPMEQTATPYRDGWTYYPPHYEYVTIGLKNRPEEPDATIYYHVAKNPYTVQPIESTEWTVYTEPIRFTEVGMYTLEDYAISPGKLMSNVTRSTIDIDALDPHDFLNQYDFRDGELYYKILSDTTVGLCARHRDADVYGLMPFYSGDIVIPETVTHEDVTYTVTAILEDTFWQSNLTSVSIPNTVTHINDSAFFESTLPRLTLPASLKHIGKEAFAYSSLPSVTIPASVESIGTGAFGSVDTIVVDRNNPIYDSRNNCNAIVETATNRLVVGCKFSKIPTSIEAIGDSAFLYIEYFNDDNYVRLPNSVKTIGKKVFQGYGIYHLEIGKGVQFIDTCAFYDCWDLWEITCHSTYPPEAHDAFICEDLPWQSGTPYDFAVLRVPERSAHLYRNHEEWGRFAHIETFDDEDNFDVDGDGKVSISDVTFLINLLLKDEWPDFADTDGNGDVNISDVAALISRILNGY